MDVLYYSTQNANTNYQRIQVIQNNAPTPNFWIWIFPSVESICVTPLF